MAVRRDAFQPALHGGIMPFSRISDSDVRLSQEINGLRRGNGGI
jgi:hypothetical protein